MNAAAASEQRNQNAAPTDLIDALNKLLITSRKLEARGWFRPNKCADGPTLRDMANMNQALALLSHIHLLTHINRVPLDVVPFLAEIKKKAKP